LKHLQIGTGLAALGVAAVLLAGAHGMRSEAGYSTLGPGFVPLVVAALLALCGVLLLREALTGGFRLFEDEVTGIAPNWRGFAWVSAGLLLTALLITRIGFVLTCALLFALAARGFRQSEGQRVSVALSVRDLGIGLLLTLPVFHLFTRALGVSLPALLGNAWI
jgi:putative tricarboxylic transport membrane protein